MTHNPVSWLVLERAQGGLEAQVYHQIRARILAGALASGEKLPSSRALAAALGLSRKTVTDAYDRLRAEGFIAASQGAATRVASLPPAPQGAARPGGPPGAALMPALPPAPAEPERFMPFRPGLPDLASLPEAAWGRCLAARARHLRIHDMGYGEEAGLPALRRAIIAHVARARAVVADPAQVIILPSTAAALDLAARLTLAPGDRVWIEEPGYPTAQAILARNGAALVPVPCDGEGMDVAAAEGPPPRLIHVTPSHQYPTGVAMSLARRLDLLERAAAHGAFVIEDDYDSEFHYTARPLAALQGIDRQGRVIYLGTFSKVLAPGIRVAYAIFPPALLAAARGAVRLMGASVAVQVQAALADFLEEGHLRAHIRRMRPIYHQRMLDTAALMARVGGAGWRAGPCDGGLQWPVWCQGADDTALAAALQAAGIGALALSRFFLGPARPGLLLGIAGATPARLAGLERQVLRLRSGPDQPQCG